MPGLPNSSVPRFRAWPRAVRCTSVLRDPRSPRHQHRPRSRAKPPPTSVLRKADLIDLPNRWRCLPRGSRQGQRITPAFGPSSDIRPRSKRIWATDASQIRIWLSNQPPAARITDPTASRSAASIVGIGNWASSRISLISLAATTRASLPRSYSRPAISKNACLES